MIERHFGTLLFVIALLFGADAEAKSPFDIQDDTAFALLQQGQLRQAKARLTEEISQTADPIRKGVLLRDLVQICAIAYDWDCVGRSLQQARPLLSADKRMSIFWPDFVLYETKLNHWYQKDDYLRGLIERGGAGSVASPIPHRTLYSELELALHDYFLQRIDGAAAEQSRSMALFGLLLADPDSKYAIAKVLVELLEAEFEGQDIVGAFALLAEANPFLSRVLAPGSVLRTRYVDIAAHALSFTNSFGPTALAFVQAADAWQMLDIDEGVKLHRMSIANSMASAAMVLDGNLDEAQAIHQRHPMHAHREDLLQRGEFRTNTEFFFGVSEVLVAVATKAKPDARWRKIFEKETTWNVSGIEIADMRSYRNFTLGLLDLSDGNVESGRTRVISAAKDRLDNFDKVLRASFEGFQIASMVDKIVIASGLTAAANRAGNDNIDLMIKGSEVLGRNLRHRLVDTAAMLAAQPNQESRRDAQAYLQLAERKQAWELQKLYKLLNGASLPNQNGDVLTDYSAAITRLSKLKQKFQNQRQGPTAGLPSLEAVQKSLGEGEAYVGYFNFLAGYGRFCIRRNFATFSTAAFDSAIAKDVKSVSDASSKRPKNLDAASRFPVASAIRVRNYLFGGLDSCLASGTHVTVALPPNFASVPLGALLAEEPKRIGEGYDLRTAHWLARDLTFSVVVSARHMLATRAKLAGNSARPYLGIGDPDFGDHARALESTEFFRGSLKTPNGILNFQPLPETADELKSAAAELGAPASSVLLGNKATEESFRSKPLAEYDVLHFATHGLTMGDAKGMTEGALVLTPGNPKDPFDDGLLSASEISQFRLNARLVILSACNTAKYDVAQASRNVQDLQAAFTVAGAPTALASLWSVDSIATQELVTSFIKNWHADKSEGAAPAFGLAVRSFLSRGDALHQHPYYWAAFTVVGNGAIARREQSPLTSVASSSFEYLSGYSDTGEILQATAQGDDLLIALIGEWNGKNMNGILSRHARDGTERWRADSRDVGMGRFAIGGTSIYVTGYASTQPPIPVLRSFDTNGREQWKTEFPDLSGFIPADVVATTDGARVLMMPVLASNVPHDVIVVSVSANGQVGKRVTLETQSTGGFGGAGVLAMWNGGLVAAITANPSRSFDFDKKDISGLPRFCWQGLRTTVYEIDPVSLDVRRSRIIEGFKSKAIAGDTSNLFLGGELSEPCGVTGVAAVATLEKSGDISVIWKDDDLFSSSVSGLVIEPKHIWVAVQRMRTIGLGLMDASHVLDYGYKHWSESTGKNEGVILKLSKKGIVLDRDDMSAGLNIFVHGLTEKDDRVLAYGSLGGVPGLASNADVAGTTPTHPISTWITDFFGSR
ncbi:CHAT domain-containing protein [Hyphomicrobium facile]|uniref:CHAT domain-containing protein n=1 Tax=Hyphomicrobium facile TaxID=51670 RepID=A0A1I7NDX5_9HYPH|nr:CHAT domain-containing protein [Hyphomicrobium facile]SFV32888.1 CHAT domain-containing protein [Hyphomicrobium facile]